MTIKEMADTILGLMETGIINYSSNVKVRIADKEFKPVTEVYVTISSGELVLNIAETVQVRAKNEVH